MVVWRNIPIITFITYQQLNKCLLALPVMPRTTNATILLSLLGILLISPTLISLTPIPRSGGGLPVPGTTPTIAVILIPPLSISWSTPLPTSLTMRDSTISVCGIWCGLTPSLPTVDWSTPSLTGSLPSPVCSEGVSKTKSPVK